MAVTLEEVNELTLRVVAGSARKRLAAGKGDILDAVMVAYQTGTPEQRRAFAKSLSEDAVGGFDGLSLRAVKQLID